MSHPDVIATRNAVAPFSVVESLKHAWFVLTTFTVRPLGTQVSGGSVVG